MAHTFARSAKHQRAACAVKAQNIDDRALYLIGGATDGAILNIAVRHIAGGGINADGLALIMLGQCHNVFGQGR